MNIKLDDQNLKTKKPISVRENTNLSDFLTPLHKEYQSSFDEISTKIGSNRPFWTQIKNCAWACFANKNEYSPRIIGDFHFFLDLAWSLITVTRHHCHLHFGGSPSKHRNLMINTKWWLKSYWNPLTIFYFPDSSSVSFDWPDAPRGRSPCRNFWVFQDRSGNSSSKNNYYPSIRQFPPHCWCRSVSASHTT